MNEFTILSKNKKELLEKINYLINDNEISYENKEKLKKWKEWYIDNSDKMNLCSLNDTQYFYRAYWNERSNVFGVQIWKELENDMVSWERNLYVNNPDVLNDDETQMIH